MTEWVQAPFDQYGILVQVIGRIKVTAWLSVLFFGRLQEMQICVYGGISLFAIIFVGGAVEMCIKIG